MDMDTESYFLNSELIVHAGGLSERWWPVTEGKLPKPRTEIGKKPRPMIDWVILPYVEAGMRHIFVSLWHKPDTIVEHLEKISENTGIKFTYLVEPEDRRLGRAGVVKYFLEKGVLSKDKPKISINSSDIIKINLKEFVDFHLTGLKQGFLATILGSPMEHSQFGRIKCDPETKAVSFFEEKPITSLPRGEYVNTGVFYLDKEVNNFFLEIGEDEFPVDLERSKIILKICKVMKCFEHAFPLKNWIWCKTPQDYKRVKDMDLERFLEIPSVEKYLGPYP